MRTAHLFVSLLLVSAAAAQIDRDTDRHSDRILTLPGSNAQVRLAAPGGVESYALSFDGGQSFTALEAARTELMLGYAQFDPLRGEPALPPALRAGGDSRLFLVQFRSQLVPAYERALTALGAEVRSFVPYQTLLVRMSGERATQVRALPFVRWVGSYHPAYRLDAALLAAHTSQTALPRQRYVMQLFAPDLDRQTLIAAIARAGGELANAMEGTSLLQAELDHADVLAIVARDEVVWLQPAGEIGTDMDVVRGFGGANQIEGLGGFTGKGVRGHIMEGVYATHPEFPATAPWRTTPIGVGNTASDQHGNATFGIVFAKGVRPQARGLCPDGQGYYTHNDYVWSRNGVRDTLVGQLQSQYGVLFQTASWGYTQVTTYTAWSVEMDELIYKRDMPITQSQSNNGATSTPRNSRPQAWAKNIISVGAVYHFNSANPAQHRWNGSTSSRASIGPAADGRIKPDICGFYDQIFTTYSSTAYGNPFGGTSAATPIVAGHLGLTLEIWTDGLLGYPMQPGGWQNRFANRPPFTTAKALLINTARQYPFAGQSADPNRVMQGWGFPHVGDVHAQRDSLLVVSENAPVKLKQTNRVLVFSKGGAVPLKATLTWSDPAALASASVTLIDDLDLKVTSPSGATVYHGNVGLLDGNWSQSGGSKNDRDTVENVYVQQPAAGLWTIDVTAAAINSSRSEVDYALVVAGARGNRERSGPTLDLTTTGKGDLKLAAGNVPAGYTEGYTLLSLSTKLPRGHGPELGIAIDGLTQACLAWPRSAGDPIHFSSTTNASQFPNAAFDIPAGALLILKGLSLDGVMVYLQGAAILDVSNVARVTM